LGKADNPTIPDNVKLPRLNDNLEFAYASNEYIFEFNSSKTFTRLEEFTGMIAALVENVNVPWPYSPFSPVIP
jgi:hypothetical protein